MRSNSAMPLDVCATAAGSAFGYEMDEGERVVAGLRAAGRFAIAALAALAFCAVYALM